MTALTIIVSGETWQISFETRNQLDGAVPVAVAWNEKRGYTKEFYGTVTSQPVIEL